MEDDEHRRRREGPQLAKKWLEGLSKGSSHELETLTMEGLKVVPVEDGLIRCNFVIPRHLTDKNDNWHAGASGVLIDDVAAAAICTSVGHIKVSVDFSISYFSPATAQDEVEIEAKVSGHKGRLSLVVVEVKKKHSPELVALAEQWMSSTAQNIAAAVATTQSSKL